MRGLPRAFLIYCCWAVAVRCSDEWRNLPKLPSGRREEYYLLHRDGGYKYGFDSGTGTFAKQAADSRNEVEGHFVHTAGEVPVDVRYRAGVDGYVPQIAISPPTQQGQPGGSYSFSYKTDDAERSESADGSGNVQGRYEYVNAAGRHDLTYRANDKEGFVVTGGSLAVPNGLEKEELLPVDDVIAIQGAEDEGSGSGDGGPSVSISKYTDNEGHELFYQTTDGTAFTVVGGSLVKPAEATEQLQPTKPLEIYSLFHHPVYVEAVSPPPVTGFSYISSYPSTPHIPLLPPLSTGIQSVSTPGTFPTQSNPADSKYSFSYSSENSARSESSDASGTVEGQYSYRDEAGNHDLSYKAQDGLGFVVTGGNLASTDSQSGTSSTSEPTNEVSSDGSYSFAYSTEDSSRSESGDSQGNVQGGYKYRNNAGEHDLSYKASAEGGFEVTGGSLSQPNGLGETAPVESATAPPAIPVEAWTAPSLSVVPLAPADKSYQFSYATADTSRSESADSNGNVNGYFSYTNEAGKHDLSYEAGPGKGFVPKGGSLAHPNGLVDAESSTTQPQPPKASISQRKIQFTANGAKVINYLPVPENIKSGYILQ